MGFGGLIAALVLTLSEGARAATTLTSTASVTLTRLTAEASIVCNAGCGGARYVTTGFNAFHTGSVDLLAAGFGSFIQAGDSVTVNGGAEAANMSPFLNFPEPATWALMLIGFGGVGGLLRRRRTTAALA